MRNKECIQDIKHFKERDRGRGEGGREREREQGQTTKAERESNRKREREQEKESVGEKYRENKDQLENRENHNDISHNVFKILPAQYH